MITIIPKKINLDDLLVDLNNQYLIENAVDNYFFRFTVLPTTTITKEVNHSEGLTLLAYEDTGTEIGDNYCFKKSRELDLTWITKEGYELRKVTIIKSNQFGEVDETVELDSSTNYYRVLPPHYKYHMTFDLVESELKEEVGEEEVDDYENEISTIVTVVDYKKIDVDQISAQGSRVENKTDEKEAEVENTPEMASDLELHHEKQLVAQGKYEVEVEVMLYSLLGISILLNIVLSIMLVRKLRDGKENLVSGGDTDG